MGNFSNQFIALLYKEFKKLIRNRLRLINEIFFPAILFGIVAIILALLPSPGKKTQSLYSQGNGVLINSNVESSIKKPEIKDMCSFSENPSLIYVGVVGADYDQISFLNLTVRGYGFAGVKSFNSDDEMLQFAKNPPFDNLNISQTRTEICGGISLSIEGSNFKYILYNDIKQFNPPPEEFLVSSYKIQPDLNMLKNSQIIGFLQVMSANIFLKKYTKSMSLEFSPMRPKDYIEKAIFYGFQLSKALVLSVLLGIIPMVSSRNLLGRLQEEKTSKIRDTMHIIGLKTLAFYISYIALIFAVNLLATILCVIILCLFVVNHSNPFAIIILVFFSSTSGIAYAFMVNIFLDNIYISRQIIAIVYPLINFIINFLSEFRFISPAGLSALSFFFPPASMYVICYNVSNKDENGYFKFVDMFLNVDGYNCGAGYFGLIISQTLWLFLTLYFDRIFYRKKSVFFGIKCCCNKTNRQSIFDGQKKDLLESRQTKYLVNEGNFETPNIEFLAQKEKNNAIIIKQLYKKFKDGTEAVKFVDLDIFEGQIFALLGHNGAGKTTMLSIMFGLMQASSGSVNAYGVDLLNDIEGLRKDIGICPQANTFYTNLTIIEHLNMFSAFKGFSLYENMEKNLENLRKLKIEDKKDHLVETLSGGELRKLMIALSLIGDPKIIMLDEPSSGLDSSSRRLVWDILGERKKGRNITIITTHYMDEADYLADRIAVMSEGVVKVCGSPLFLKKNFGVGYILTIENNNGFHDINEYILNSIPESKLRSNIGSEIIYSLPFSSVNYFEQMFIVLENQKASNNIYSYGITMTTLEDVFLKVGKRTKIVQEPLINYKMKISQSEENLPFDALLKPFQDCLCLIYKELLNSIRTPKTFFFELFLPVVMFLSMIIQVNIIINFRLERTISLSKFPFPIPQYAIYNKYDKNNYDTTQYIQNIKTLKLIETGLINSNHIDFKEFIGQYDEYILNLFEGNLNPEFGQYGSYYIINSDLENSHSIVFGNLTSPMSLYFYSHLLIEQILTLVSPNAKLQGEIRDFNPFRNQLDLYTSIAKSGLFFMLVGAILSQFTGRQCVNISKDRDKGIKHHLHISGLSLLGYWMGLFISDIIKEIVPIIALIICYLSFGIKLPYCWIMMLIFPLGNTPLTFLLSFIFESEEIILIIVPLIGFIIGLVPAIIISAAFYFPSTKDLVVAKVFNEFFKIHPVYSLSCGLIKSFLFQYFITDKSESLGSYGNMGQYITAIFIECICYSGGIFLLELIIAIRKKRQAVVSSNENDETKTEIDSDVTNEKKRVKYLNNDISIKVEDLRKTYGKFVAVDNVSFGVDSGEIFALLGVNGAGKTSTFNMITGNIGMTNGRVFLKGNDINKNIFGVKDDNSGIFIGFCPQQDIFFENLTVKEHFEFYAKIKGISPDIRNALIDELINTLKFNQEMNKYAHNLSIGNKRKLTLSLSLLGHPNILLLDEPSAGLDPKSRKRMWRLIEKISKETKHCSVILTTHSMEEAEALSTKLGIMIKGNLICFGSCQHIKEKYAKSYDLYIKFRKLSLDTSFIDALSNEFGKSINLVSAKELIKRIELTNYEIIIAENAIEIAYDDDQSEIKTIEEILSLVMNFITKQNILKELRSKFRSEEIIENSNEYLRLRIDKEENMLCKLFNFAEKIKQIYNIEEYSVSQTSLEQIFQMLAQKNS